MNTTAITKNWEVNDDAKALKAIRNKAINMAIWNRNTNRLTKEIDLLVNRGVELQSRGNVDSILNTITNTIGLKECGLIIQDIHKLLHIFKEISYTKNFLLLLTTVNTNMCRRFHTDGNDLRMLCTYSGPGTLWLTEDNVNRKVLNTGGDNERIVIDESKIQQAKTGSVLILKGTLYPQQGTSAVVHRSPTIEESSEKRLLLRIDTNEFPHF